MQGQDVVNAIANVPCGGAHGSDPQQDVLVESMTVLQKRNHPYEPRKNDNRR